MLEDKLTLLIHSCDKFSDLWDAHMKLLGKNWPDRAIRTIILTDAPTNRHYDNVEIISAGADKEITDRIRYVLPFIKTEYVLVTLDDYFPIYPINTNQITRLVDIMEERGYDYVRLFKEPKCHLCKTADSKIYTYTLDRDNRINLYAGIWKKSFINNTLSPESLTAWDYEVSLTPAAAKIGAQCAMSKGNEFPILDVVRKGKILRPAARYLRKYNMYTRDRETMSLKDALFLNVKICGQRIFRNAPKPVFMAIRSMMMAMGMKSFSGEIKNKRR